jgi:ribosome-binding protein aMBF1 (putative translation factor)
MAGQGQVKQSSSGGGAKQGGWTPSQTADTCRHVVIKVITIDHAVSRLDDPEDQWVDADEVRIQLAAERIAAARKGAGLTQKQLGEKLNLPQSQISRIERKPDHTTVRTLKRIAKALGVDVRALIG